MAWGESQVPLQGGPGYLQRPEFQYVIRRAISLGFSFYWTPDALVAKHERFDLGERIFVEHSYCEAEPARAAADLLGEIQALRRRIDPIEEAYRTQEALYQKLGTVSQPYVAPPARREGAPAYCAGCGWSGGRLAGYAHRREHRHRVTFEDNA